MFGRYTLDRPIELCDAVLPRTAGESSPSGRCARSTPACCASTSMRRRATAMSMSIWPTKSRYLLPRWLELIAADESVGRLSDDDGLTVMMPTQWRARWPADEVATLDALLRRAVSRCDAGARGDQTMTIPCRGLRGRNLWWFLLVDRCRRQRRGAAAASGSPRRSPAAIWIFASPGSRARSPRMRSMPGLRAPSCRRRRRSMPIARGARDRRGAGAQCQCERCQQKVAAWEWLAEPAFRERLETARRSQKPTRTRRSLLLDG